MELDHERFTRDVKVMSFEAEVQGRRRMYHRLSADWLERDLYLGPDGEPISPIERKYVEDKLSQDH